MDNKQYNALFFFIWNIANDVLVHAFENGDYKKIILPFMFFCSIDVLLEHTKTTAFQMYFANQVPQISMNASVLQAAINHLSPIKSL